MPRELSIAEKKTYDHFTSIGGIYNWKGDLQINYMSSSLKTLKQQYRHIYTDVDADTHFKAYFLTTQYFKVGKIDINNPEHKDLFCFCIDKVFNQEKNEWKSFPITEQIKIIKLFDSYLEAIKPENRKFDDTKLALNMGSAVLAFASPGGAFFSGLRLGFATTANLLPSSSEQAEVKPSFSIFDYCSENALLKINSNDLTNKSMQAMLIDKKLAMQHLKQESATPAPSFSLAEKGSFSLPNFRSDIKPSAGIKPKPIATPSNYVEPPILEVPDTTKSSTAATSCKEPVDCRDELNIDTAHSTSSIGLEFGKKLEHQAAQGSDEALGQITDMMEKNEKVVSDASKNVPAEKKAEPSRIPIIFLKSGAALAELMYKFHQVHEGHQQYKTAKKALKEELKRARNQFNLSVNISDYRRYSLPTLQITLAQSINHSAYITIRDTEELIRQLKEQCLELKQYISTSEKDRASLQSQIAGVHDKQKRIASSIGINLDKTIAYIHQTVHLAATLAPEGVSRSALIIGSALTGIIAAKDRANTEKNQRKGRELIQRYADIAQHYNNLVQSANQNIQVYQNALEANYNFMRQNAHLFSGTELCEQLTSQIAEKQEQKTKLGEVRTLIMDVITKAETTKSTCQAQLKSETQKKSKKSKKTESVEKDILKVEVKGHNQSYAVQIAEADMRISSAKLNLSELTKNENHLQQEILALNKELERAENLKPIQDWFYQKTKQREEGFYNNLPIDSPERKEYEARVARGEFNASKRQAYLQNNQAAIKIAEDAFRGVGLILENLHTLLGSKRAQTVLGSKPLSILNAASVGLNITSTGYSCYVLAWQQMRFSYENLKKVMGDNSISDYLKPDVILDYFKSPTGGNLGSLMTEFGGKMGALEFVDAFVNPSLMIVGKLIGLITQTTGIAPPTPLEITLEALKSLSEQMAKGFHSLGKGQFEMKKSLLEISESIYRGNTTIRLMQQMMYVQLVNQEMNIQQRIGEVRGDTQLILSKSGLEDIVQIRREINAQIPEIKSCINFFPTVAANTPYNLFKMYRSKLAVALQSSRNNKYIQADFPVEKLFRAVNYEDFAYYLKHYLDMQGEKTDRLVPFVHPRVYLECADATLLLARRVRKESRNLDKSISSKTFDEKIHKSNQLLQECHNEGQPLCDFMNQLTTDITWLKLIQKITFNIYQKLNHLVNERLLPRNQTQSYYEELDSDQLNNLGKLQKLMEQNMVGSLKFIWQDIFYTPLYKQIGLTSFDMSRWNPFRIFYHSHTQKIIQLGDAYHLASFLDDLAARQVQGRNLLIAFSQQSNQLVFQRGWMKLEDAEQLNSLVKIILAQEKKVIESYRTYMAPNDEDGGYHVASTGYISQRTPYRLITHSPDLYVARSIAKVTEIMGRSEREIGKDLIESKITTHAFIMNKPLVKRPLNVPLTIEKDEYDSILKNYIQSYFELIQKLSDPAQDNSVDESNYIVITSDSSELIPLIFPKKYLDALRENEQLARLYQAVKLNLGRIKITYTLQQSKEGNKDFLLMLNYTFFLADIQLELPAFRVVVATFDTVVINSFKRFNVKDNDLDVQINLNEFLLLAMRSPTKLDFPAGGLGFPASGSTDLNGDGVIAPVELPFIGLFSILNKLRTTFHYKSNEYNQKTHEDILKFISTGNKEACTNFMTEELIIHPGKGYQEFLGQLAAHSKIQAQDACSSTKFRQLLRELWTAFEAALIGLQLAYNIDMETAIYLLEKINIHDPQILSNLTTADISQFMDLLDNYARQEVITISEIGDYLVAKSPLLDALEKKLESLTSLINEVKLPDIQADETSALNLSH